MNFRRIIIFNFFLFLSTYSFSQNLEILDNHSKFVYTAGSDVDLSYDHFSKIMFFEDYTDNNYGDIGQANFNFVRRIQYNNEPTMEFAYPNAQGLLRNFSWRTLGVSKMFLKGNGNLGIGTTTPAAKVQIEDGDIYLKDFNSGVIMKSANGKCWRFQADDSGNLISTEITCPN